MGEYLEFLIVSFKILELWSIGIFSHAACVLFVSELGSGLEGKLPSTLLIDKGNIQCDMLFPLQHLYLPFVKC